MDDDLEYELSYLSAYDMHPFKDTDMKKATGATVRARAEKNVQLLVNRLFALERVEVRFYSLFFDFYLFFFQISYLLFYYYFAI